jgi:phospholipid/cholesterol/gamma-HCH transport system substrate-binding protein
MSENTTETLIGGLVLAVAAGFLYFAAQSTGISRPGGSYELTASFRSAEGVTVGTDVRMAGVKIGSVTALGLNPLTYRADARFTVLKGLELATDTQVLVSSESLLGGSFVEIVPGGAPGNLADGDEIEDTQGAISVVTLLLKFVTGGSE